MINDKITLQHAPNILQAIATFEQSPQLTVAELIEELRYKAADGQEPLAIALYRFLPLAYCQEILPEVNYPDYYIRPDQSRFLLAANTLFEEIKQVVAAKFLHGLAEKQMLAVLQHCPQFQEINNALHEGAKLEEISISPLRF